MIVSPLSPTILPYRLTIASTNEAWERSRRDIGESSSRSNPENQNSPTLQKLSDNCLLVIRGSVACRMNAPQGGAHRTNVLRRSCPAIFARI